MATSPPSHCVSCAHRPFPLPHKPSPFPPQIIRGAQYNPLSNTSSEAPVVTYGRFPKSAIYLKEAARRCCEQDRESNPRRATLGPKRRTSADSARQDIEAFENVDLEAGDKDDAYVGASSEEEYEAQMRKRMEERSFEARQDSASAVLL
jgi:hypothetical protein